MSILKIRSRQETLAIQFTGDNQQALIDFIGENYVEALRVRECIQEMPPELFDKKLPKDFFEMLRIVVNSRAPSPYMLQVYPQDWLKKREILEGIYQFSVLGGAEFQYVGNDAQEAESVMQFSGKNKKALIKWIGKQHIHSWEENFFEGDKEFRIIVDPVLTDFYSIFLSRQDWLVKETLATDLLSSILKRDCSSHYYQFEAVPNEIFREKYEIIEENVSANTPLKILNRLRVMLRTQMGME